MKKKTLKHLSLNKKVVSKLDHNLFIFGGAASDGPTTCQVCPVKPIELPTIDIPTFNDSCFSLCRDKCNDF